MAQAHPMSDFGRNLPVVQIRLLDTVLFQDCRVGGVSALLFVLVFVMHFSHCQLLSWTGRGASVLSGPQMR